MRPKIILHIECSLDGRIDWLKPDNFLYYRVIADWHIDGMISGSRTLQLAEMSEEGDKPKQSQQYLVIVDSKGSIHHWEVIKKQAWWNETPIVLCSESTPTSYFYELQANNIHSIVSGKNKVDLNSALQALYHRFNIKTLRIDSGGILTGVMLRQHLVDEVSVVISPQLTGGKSPKSIYVAPDLQSLQGIVDLHLVQAKVWDEHFVHLYYQVIGKNDH